jgi:hypothetical protein
MEVILLKMALIFLMQENNAIKQNNTKQIKPDGYEYALFVLDHMSPINLPLKENEVIIVISRLGKGENPIYNKRRLFTVKSYLTKDLKVPENKLVTAIGEPVEGYGILEFYINSKKSYILTAGKNQEMAITELSTLTPRYYLPKPKFRKKTKSQ